MNININSYYETRKVVFDKVQESNTVTKILMALLMASFTGIVAQIMIPLPWTPVPITGQTFGVLVAGLFLGKKYGSLSQIFYVILGIAFIPWFTGMSGGLDVLLGATGGYLIGFIIASYFIGYISEKYADARKFKKMIAVIGVANFGLIYIPGLLGLFIWSYLSQGTVLNPIELIIMGLAPFIIGDLIKVVGSASVSKVFLPKN